MILDDLRKSRGEHSVSARERCVTAVPPPSMIRSDKQVIKAKCSMRGACEKRHIHIEIVSLPFAHRTARNSRQLSDFTHHCKKIMFFSGSGKAIFRPSKHFSISSGLFLGNLPNFFFFFLALKYTLTTGLTDINELKEKTNFVLMKFCNCTLWTSFFLRSTGAGFTVQYINLQNSRGQSQNLSR